MDSWWMMIDWDECSEGFKDLPREIKKKIIVAGLAPKGYMKDAELEGEIISDMYREVCIALNTGSKKEFKK